MPEEELRLDVFASYDDDDLQRLEDDLENVDDAIAASGKGNREVNIDVDTDAIIAAGELEALDEVIESVDDDVEVDIETESDLNQLTESVDDDVEIDVETKEKLNEVIESVDDEVEIDIETESDLNKVIESVDDEIEIDVETESELNKLIQSVDDEIEIDVETESELNEVIESVDDEIETDVEIDTDNISESNFNNDTDDISKRDISDESVDSPIVATQVDIDDALVTTDEATVDEATAIVKEGYFDETTTATTDTDTSDSDPEVTDLNSVVEDFFDGGDSDSGSDSSTDVITSSRAGGGLAAEGLDEDIEIDVNQAVGTEKVLADMRQTQREIGDDSISLDDVPDLVSRDADRRSGVFNRAKNEFSESLSGAKDGLKDFQFTIAAFNQVLVSVFPALLSFVGAIPAAIVALGGLAAAAITAMGALGAVGILGLGGIALQGNGELDIQPILNRLQSIFDAFITAFTPLMKTFVAPVKNAFNTIEALADPLAQAASGLTAFQSLFNDTLATVAQGLPSFTAKLVAFGQAAIPILRGFIQFVNNTNFIGFFAEQLQRASGSIFLIIESVKQLVPFIINLSQGFLFVASAILTLIGGLAFIFNFFPRLTGVIGAVIGALLLLVTATTLYSIVTASSAVKAGLAFAGSLLKSAGAAIIAKFGIVGLTLAVVALTSAITLGLAGVISFSGAFDDLTGSIMGANSSLREFNKLTGRSSFSSGFNGPGSPIGQTGGQGSTYDVTVNSSGDKDSAARSAYLTAYEIKQREQTNSIFGI